MRECEASLRRLQTDHIDLYQIHGWDSLTPLEETLRALDGLVRAGKVRYIGLLELSWRGSGHPALDVGSAPRPRSRYITAQMYYSLVGRELEHEFLPFAATTARHPGVEPARGRFPYRQVRSPASARGRHAIRRGRSLRAVRSSSRLRAVVDRRVCAASPSAGAPRRHNRARVAASAPGGDVAHHRRPHRGAVPRQPRQRRREADRRRARASRQGEPAAA